MANFDVESYENLLIYNNLVGFHDAPINLSAGGTSVWYVNMRRIYNSELFFRRTVSFVIDFIKDLNIDPMTICGVPFGTTVLGARVQEEFLKSKPESELDNYPVVSLRPTPKLYGDIRDRNFLGTPKPPILLIEDVTTSALSILKAMSKFHQQGFNVKWVISLVNRMEWTPMQNSENDEKFNEYKKVYEELAVPKSIYSKQISASEAVGMAGAKYFSLTNPLRLLPKAIEIMKIDDSKIAILKEERRVRGIEPKPFLKIKNRR